MLNPSVFANICCFNTIIPPIFFLLLDCLRVAEVHRQHDQPSQPAPVRQQVEGRGGGGGGGG